ncbi:Tachykinin-like peptides receptor 99D [Eumeta japonica]|uniref:Tachykinin-like peptides receptor 99D n=1 Tax=Eumeta variegata TaxID=151549 RepID=A0A4C2A543_EUMVA|nr:Tachykinin-like peptides receptor 99D [Eumeta japonica]
MSPLRPRLGKKATLAITAAIWLGSSALSLPNFIYFTTEVVDAGQGNFRRVCYTMWPDGLATGSKHEYADQEGLYSVDTSQFDPRSRLRRVNWCREMMHRYSGGDSNAVYDMVIRDEFGITVRIPKPKDSLLKSCYREGLFDNTFDDIFVNPDFGTTTPFPCFRYNVAMLVLTYFLPIASMTYTYARVGLELWGSQSIGECTQRQMENIKSKRRVRAFPPERAERCCAMTTIEIIYPAAAECCPCAIINVPTEKNIDGIDRDNTIFCLLNKNY